MSFFNNRERRLAEHAVLSATLTLARLAGWSLDKHAPLLPSQFHDYLYVPETQLLLAPGFEHFGRLRGQVTRATREARADGIILMLGRNARGLVQPYLSIGLWSVEETCWFGPHLPWIYSDGQLWAVPDPLGGADDQPSIMLGMRPLRPATNPPWASNAARYLGLARADAAFANLQGQKI